MKHSCPLLLTQHLLLFHFHFSRRFYALRNYHSLFFSRFLTFLLYSLLSPFLCCPLSHFLPLVSPLCPTAVGVAGSTASCPGGPRGNRGRGGMFDLELQLCFSMGNLHLFHLHSELPEEEGKWGTMKLWATGLVLPLLAYQWLEMQQNLIKILVNCNSSKTTWTPVPNGCEASSLRSCLISWPESKACW